MLFSPPPGYNASAVNRQNIGTQAVPGQQGNIAQGYPANPFRSSYAAPSSSSVPSAVPAANAYYNQPKGNPNMMMAKALKGGM